MADIRVEKTLKAIREAYLEEKKTKSIAEIKVYELCNRARINKSTFYKYYLDVYDLAEKVEEQVVEEILNGGMDLSQLMTDTKAFLDVAAEELSKNYALLALVFDNRVEREASVFEKHLLKKYLNGAPSKQEEMVIRFCIGGASRVLTQSGVSKESVALARRMVIGIIGKIKEFTA